MKRIRRAAAIGIAALLIVAWPALAVSITQCLYQGDLVVANSGTATTNVATVATINGSALVAGSYCTADYLNTALQTSGGTDIVYMPGYSTNPWCIFVPSIGLNEQLPYIFYAGGPAIQTGFMYFPASGGMTINDSPSLELGNIFQIEMKGFIDTAAGSNKNLIYKQDAFRVYISAEGNIRAAILTTGDAEVVSVTATSIDTNAHTVKVIADAYKLKIFVDGQEKDSVNLGANSVPNNANIWNTCQNGSVVYLEYLKMGTPG
jgi:hypothetical protein